MVQILVLPATRCMVVVVQLPSHVRLSNPMDCSTPASSPFTTSQEFAQIHVYLVSDGIQPSHPLPTPSPPALNFSQHGAMFKERKEDGRERGKEGRTREGKERGLHKCSLSSYLTEKETLSCRYNEAREFCFNHQLGPLLLLLSRFSCVGLCATP